MRRLLLIAGGTLAGLLIAEVSLWFLAPPESWRRYDTASPAESGRWQDHPFLPYIGKPNSDIELRNGPRDEIERITTNSYGFRAHEFPKHKEPNDYFVLCFGGSTTYGYKVASNDQTWPEILERMLDERYPEKHVQVFNLGIDMATSDVSVVNLALVGIHLEPDLVLVYHGYNDLSAMGAANFRTDHAHFYGDLHMEGVWRGFQSAVPVPLRRSYLVHYLTGALDLRMGVNDLAREVQRERIPDPDRLRGIETTLQNFKTMRAIAAGRDAETVFATFQFTDGQNPTHRELNERMRRYFAEEGLRYVDQDALLPDGDPALQVDACHFTPRGNERFARNFFDYIVANDLVR